VGRHAPAGVVHPGGAPVPGPVDATTTGEGHRWALAIQDRLREAGHTVGWGQDEGEDGRGNPSMYDDLAAFRVARDVRATVRDVTGYAIRMSQVLPDDRALSGER
jgi:hypothetical protein